MAGGGALILSGRVKRGFTAAAAVISAVVLIVAVFSLVNRFLLNSNPDTVEEISVHDEFALTSILDDEWECIDTLTAMLKTPRVTTEKSVIEALRIYNERYSESVTMLVDEDGTCLRSDGVIKSMPELYESISGNDGNFAMHQDEAYRELAEAKKELLIFGKRIPNMTIDGSTYIFPFLYRQNVLVYSNEWFRKAGLGRYVSDGSEVQTWSMNEWITILAALRKAMPDTAYPLMMYTASNQGDTHVCSFIRSRGGRFFDEERRFDLEEPEGVAGLAWIKSCLDAGYMPTNAAEIDILTNYDLFQNGQLTIYMCNCASEPNFSDYGLVNFPCVDGGIDTNFLTGFEVYDNGDEAKLAAAKAFVEFVYASEYIDFETEAIPCNTSVAEKHAYFLAPVQKYINNADKGVDFTGGNPDWLGVRSVFSRISKSFFAARSRPRRSPARLTRTATRRLRKAAPRAFCIAERP